MPLRHDMLRYAMLNRRCLQNSIHNCISRREAMLIRHAFDATPCDVTLMPRAAMSAAILRHAAYAAIFIITYAMPRHAVDMPLCRYDTLLTRYARAMAADDACHYLMILRRRYFFCSCLPLHYDFVIAA